MDRRALIAGATASIFEPAHADPRGRLLFGSGPLATNRVARSFEAAPANLALPNLALKGDDGRSHRLKELLGRPALFSLWSEICAPCLAEAPDLAELAQRHRTGRVTILALLTQSAGKLDAQGARARLDRSHAQGLPTWIEPNGGTRLLDMLARRGRDDQGTLPCNLLVDSSGRVRGRSFGATLTPMDPHAYDHLDAKGHLLTATGKAQIRSIPARSMWATSDADAFILALAAGAIESHGPRS